MSSKSLPYKVEKCYESDLLKLSIPHSKSYANRLLILAAMTKENITLSGMPDSSDVLTMIECFKAVGLEVQKINDKVTVKGSFPECEKSSQADKIKVFTGDGGTTNRFILPFLARGKKEYELIPEGHMKNRPMEPQIKSLKNLGVKVTRSKDIWISVKGPFQKDAQTKVDCSDSTQFLTGLALATADLNLKIIPENLSASLLYWKITETLIQSFQEKKLDYLVPPDFSGASYPMALGATIRPVLIENCFKRDFLQADSKFMDFLEEMGCKIKMTKDGLYLEPPERLTAIEVDGSQCPDLIPTLAYVCSYAQGVSKLNNLFILRHKESDRVKETINILKSFNINFDLDEHDNLTIYGTSKTIDKKIELYPAPDHRMVMVGFLFMIKNEGGILYNAGHVAKSFPDFFLQMS